MKSFNRDTCQALTRATHLRQERAQQAQLTESPHPGRSHRDVLGRPAEDPRRFDIPRPGAQQLSVSSPASWGGELTRVLLKPWYLATSVVLVSLSGVPASICVIPVGGEGLWTSGNDVA